MSAEADLEGTIAILRACLISSKGGVDINILNRDYKSLVGSPIPYAQFGFYSIEDFLKSIKDIRLFYGHGGEITVRAIPSDDSAHIASLVSKQKPTQKKRSAVPSFGRRRLPNRYPPPTYKSAPVQRDKVSVTVNNDLQGRSSRLVSLKPNVSTGTDEPVKHKYELPPRLQKSKTEDFDTLQLKPISSDPSITSYESGLSGLDDLETYQSGFNQQAKKSIVSPYSPRYAVEAGRAQTQALAVKELESKYTNIDKNHDEMEHEVQDMGNEYNMEVAPWNRVKRGFETEMPSETYICKLLKLCLAKGWPDPAYKIIERRPKNKPVIYGCQVKVGKCEQHFSSYPDESHNRQEAKELAAKKAYRAYSTDMDSDETEVQVVTNDISVIQDRLFDLSSKHTAGIWADSIPSKYSSMYKEQLPSDWLNMASAFANITLNPVCEGRVIICPNMQQLMTNGTKNNASLPNLPSGIRTQISPPPDNNWDVFVTWVESSEEIYVRIIGNEYSGRYESLSYEMDLYYTQNARNFEAPPSDLHEEGYYAARICEDNTTKDSWHRVYVQKVTWEEEIAEVWLVDNGEVVEIPLKNILHLAETFTSLPRQAVVCSLAGFEHHDDPVLVDLMDELLLGKVLVAQVVKREDTLPNSYSLVFYDTSSEDDVNINEELINKLILDSKPQLPDKEGVKDVYVSHITEECQLYVQVHNTAFTHLLKLIENLSNDVIMKHYFTSPRQLLPDKIYIAKSKKGGWHRAVLTQRSLENQVIVNFIDYGNTELVNIRDVSNLEAISNVLSRIPPQALPVLLHEVKIGKQEYECIQRMVTINERVILKVKVVDVIAKVEIFKRTAEPNGAIISINNSILLFDSEQSAHKLHTTRRSKSKTRIVMPSASEGSTVNNSTVNLTLKPPKIPDNTTLDYFEIFVPLAANPSNFTVQPLESINQLKELSLQMKDFYKENCSILNRQTFKEGGLYAALFPNKQWYRVTLAQILKNQHISVRSCDFGEFMVIPDENLRYLAVKFTELPYQAIKAKLTGFGPVHSDWGVEDCIRFQQLVVDKQLISIVREEGHDVLDPTERCLGLTLIDTNTDDDVLISDILVREGRAKIVEEHS